MDLDQLIFVDKEASEGKLKWLTHMANHSNAHSSTRPASGMHTSLNPLRNCSRSAKDMAIAPGRQSKAILIAFVMSSAVKAPCSVLYVSTKKADNEQASHKH